MSDLRENISVLLHGAWRRRYMIVIPMLVLPILGFGVSKLVPTTYVAHTSMLIQETAKMNPFLQDIAVSTMLKDRLSALSTLLKSRHVLYSVAKEQGLIDDDMGAKEQEFIIKDIASRLSVQQLGKDFIQIQLRSGKAQGMESMLTSVSNRFVEQLLAPERSSIKDSSHFLTIHINKRREELDKAEHAFAEYKNTYSHATPEMQAQSLTRLASLKQTLAEKEAELAGVTRSLGSLDQQLSKTNPVIGKIEEQIIEIRSELTLLRAKYTEAHSLVQGKLRELKRLEQERTVLLSSKQPELNSNQLWDIASNATVSSLGEAQPLLVSQLHQLQIMRSRFESLTEETVSLQKMIQELESNAHRFGSTATEINRLARDVAVKREMYDDLVERYEMAQLTGSLGVFEENKRVKIIDAPFTPTIPSNLPSIVFIILGFIGGAGLGVGLATLLELADNSVRSRRALEKYLGVPVITTLPKVTFAS
ncbi:chain-length determining protein [Vibrio parahaemolyticus]|uniref:GumC family protein n=1 Tax=Vibrio parahaemolyticus TaxID=670 RepID=UPI00038E5B3A|nr:chain length determinant family protein [Vibrio parahaemolyticus]EJG0922169.1 chain-length determining protein [Vibrio parahaemolyticus O1:K68]EJG0931715.1 chain-length determining protein [Vibrio parahaemolyticus O1]EJG0946022.1 chain-length determining protein [Vibrio parahaemolyticus O10]EQM46615.1 chain length determinant family protein [Vibrio parahaemolyticus VPCR-2010]EGQ9063905.1 chain-length determining protein [Vibrio parahaemolyticus]